MPCNTCEYFTWDKFGTKIVGGNGNCHYPLVDSKIRRTRDSNWCTNHKLCKPKPKPEEVVEPVADPERKQSRRITVKVKGSMVIENSVASGTPDLCLPTAHGWLWVELKMINSYKILVKRSQWASIHADLRTLPPSLHRLFWVFNEDGLVCSYTSMKIMEYETEATKDGILVSIPPEDWTPCGLVELLGHFGVYIPE